ncbi:phosphatases II [Rhizodiscina lignyota]|uniref:protein-tyrosine-phosphatase n=1 Tax=Rhizodiscina lignyota TaxID=1504668 RepID=A0A9P4IJL4_9PEZI|nr:phosphatases II [Rhizodiscina lignyota]
MAKSQTPELSPIKAIPGLFISDRFAAAAPSNIREHNIVRVLSIVRPNEIPQSHAERFTDSSSQDNQPEVEIRSIPIDDDPTEDILQHLRPACDWIEQGLERRLESNSDVQAGVLVHCRLGISRSGAFVVAYLMHKLQLSFSAALALARDSRSMICPNDGFERQLRIWEICEYDIYTDEPSAEAAERKEKRAYTVWKAERDNLLKRGEEDVNRARFSSMASMAAHFGKRRQEASRDAEIKREKGEEESADESERKEGWDKVKKMEEEWNDRLKRGITAGENDGNS